MLTEENDFMEAGKPEDNGGFKAPTKKRATKAEGKNISANGKSTDKTVPKINKKKDDCIDSE
jgi:hypothetical protein